MTTLSLSSFVLFGALEWIAPLWLISVGVAAGFVVLAIAYGLLALAKPAVARETMNIVRQGPLGPLTIVGLSMAGFALVATVLVPYQTLLASAGRLTKVGDLEKSVVIEPGKVNEAVPLGVRANEIRVFHLVSDRDITVMPNNDQGAPEETFLYKKVRARNPIEWREGAGNDKDNKNLVQRNPFYGMVDTLFISNLTTAPAKIDISVSTRVEYTEVLVIPQVALAVLILYALYFAFRLSMPKVAAIAEATTKEGTSQPIFYVALAAGAFFLVTFIFIPYNTFGEDVKMLKDSGLTLIMVLGILVALWTSSVSVAEEIEGRTALTVLSKPVSRRQFILGKFFGVIGPVFLLFVFLGLIFLFCVSYKVVYDARETANPDPTWRDCFLEMQGIIPGLVLAFLETVTLAAVSVAISTRLPMLANLMICFSIYVLGHLVPQLVVSSVGKFPIVTFMGQLLATVLPVLEHFNIQAAVAAGAPVPPAYLLWALLYCVLYSTVAMLFALALFEDRDVA
ncbi:MAG: hypothetical protein U0836_11845 [Pirellulales bacterium]